MVPVTDDDTLWVEVSGCMEESTVMLVAGANAPGLMWPQTLVEWLGINHKVIRYDHRDTGRSTHRFDESPYPIPRLADDAVAVLDAAGVDRAHVVGMSLGGVLVQLLALDHPDRILSATAMCTTALGSGLADTSGDDDLPPPDPRLLELWEHLADARGLDEEIAFRVEHWRILNGSVLPFDAGEFSALERRIIDHTGTHRAAIAHAMAEQSGLDRGRELAGVTVPFLVVEAPEDPINPPPHAANLAGALGGARLVTVPGMGHALPEQVIPRLGMVLEDFFAEVDPA